MNNTRFATALHILSLLADSEDEWLSSDWIAGSINVNPVVIRRELGPLVEAGFVEGRKGKHGGSRLAKAPKDIGLDQIYRVVKNSEVLGKKNENPSPKCPIGKDINQKLDLLFQDIDQSVVNKLKQQSLEDFVAQFH